jgi:hypothetical protein
MTHPTAATSAREPIKRPLLWILIGAAVLAGIPWYVPAGTVEPFVLGIPAWFLASVAAAVALSAITCWACLTQWQLADVEDALVEGEEVDR